MVAKGYLLSCATSWVSDRTPLHQKQGREGPAEVCAGRSVNGCSGKLSSVLAAQPVSELCLWQPLTRNTNVSPRVYLLFSVSWHQRVPLGKAWESGLHGTFKWAADMASVSPDWLWLLCFELFSEGILTEAGKRDLLFRMLLAPFNDLCQHPRQIPHLWPSLGSAN